MGKKGGIWEVALVGLEPTTHKLGIQNMRTLVSPGKSRFPLIFHRFPYSTVYKICDTGMTRGLVCLY